MERVKLLTFGCHLLLLLLAVEAKSHYKFEFYQHAILEVQTPTVFGPKTGFVGTGYVFNNPATVNSDIHSKEIGRVSGLYYFNADWVSEQFSTVYFNASAHEFFAGDGALYFRGLWFHGEAGDSRFFHQQTAILGGTQKLKGAHGYADYDKVDIPGSDEYVFRVQTDSNGGRGIKYLEVVFKILD
ncbi:hypothetical protein R1sor_025339 [Riccia sorocarpa]|uniref:Dirigent protein n=1 Tax=Riccia sorocarpa TaxID=122646 RepID=A0ABD3G9Y0_9MARC